MPDTDVTKMKVADLKRELKMRGLVTTGNKTELQDRLQTALIDGELSLEDTAICGEDQLLDEDAVLTDEEEAKILCADENELLKSPTSQTNKTVKLVAVSKTSAAADVADIDDILALPTTSQLAKKIVLKRKNSFTTLTATAGKLSVATATDQPAKENTEPSSAKTTKMSQRHPITIGNGSESGNATSVEKDDSVAGAAATKVSQLSLQERLELRAKKFGISASSTTAAATPGAPKASSTMGAGTVANINSSAPVDEKQIEMLKKRAERFGCVVSSKIAKIDAEEKLEKRKQRFSGSDGITTTTNADASSNASEWADKARQRLERFKTSSTVTLTTTSSATAN